MSRKHGCSGTPEYLAWANMIRRCENPHHADFANYGARGIRVCEEWRVSFETFFADVGRRPPGMSLDRINNDGPYAPDNVRWASDSEQMRNRRPFKNEKKLTPSDRATIAMRRSFGHAREDLAREYGVSVKYISMICVAAGVPRRHDRRAHRPQPGAAA